MEKYTREGVLYPVLFCFCLLMCLHKAQASSTLFSNLSDTIKVTIEGQFYICENATNQLAVLDEYDEILWSVVGNDGNIVTSDLTLAEIEIDQAGTYKVSVKDMVDGQSLTGEAQIVVQLSKVYGGISPSTRKEICEGESINLLAFGGAQNFDSYSWGEPIEGNTNTSVTVSPTITTTYSLIVENENTCVDSFQYEVVVRPNPEVTFSDYDLKVCEKSEVQVGVMPNNQFKYHWNTGDSESSISKVIRNDEVYKVTVSNQYDCIKVLETELIEVEELDLLQMNAEENVFPINSTIEFSVQGIINNDCFDSFVWSIDDKVVTGQSNSTAQLNFNGTNNKQIVCVTPQLNANCDCTYDPICMEVFVVNDGECSASINKEIYQTCENGIVTLEGDSSPGEGASSVFISSNWKINGVIVDQSTNTDNFNVISYEGIAKKSSTLELMMNEPGQYNVTWQVEYQQCTKTREAVIRVLSNPDVEIVYDESIGCVGEEFDFHINAKNNLNYNYLFTYSIDNQQETKELTSGSPNQIKYVNNGKDSITFTFIQLQDKDSGCLYQFSNESYGKKFYEPLELTVDTICNEVNGTFYSSIKASEGSGAYQFIGAGNSISNNTFETVTLIEGNGTLIEVNDEKCPSFNQKVESYVTCSCIDTPIRFKNGTYEGCEGGSIFVPIEVGPTFAKSQDNVLYYEIHTIKGTTDTLVTGEIDLSDCEVFEECEVEIPYDPSLLIDESYNLVSYISKYVPDTDSIDRDYRCFNYFTVAENPVKLKYKSVDVLQLNTYKDTVCLNQQNQVYGVENVPFKYSVDWETESEGVTFEQITPYHISASFSESGNKKIKMTQKFNLGKAVCEQDQEVEIYVRQEEAPGLVDIALVPGNVFVAQTTEYDCFKWGYINTSNGDVVEGTNKRHWILSAVNIDKFVYFVDVWTCGSDCKSRTYFNRDKPFVFVTGNQETNTKNEYLVYPNPTSSDIIVEGIESSYEHGVYITNTLGQKTRLRSFTISADKIQAEVHRSLQKGLYYLTVENDEHRILLKKTIIIQ